MAHNLYQRVMYRRYGRTYNAHVSEPYRTSMARYGSKESTFYEFLAGILVGALHQFAPIC